MINFVTGLLSILLLSLFAGGLALSIGSIEFGIIVVLVVAMSYIDFFQSLGDSRDDSS